MKSTAEGPFEDRKQREGGEEGMEEAQECKLHGEEAVKKEFVMINPGTIDLSMEEVEKRNEELRALASGRRRKWGVRRG